MHWGWKCTVHIELPDVGPGNVSQGVSPSLGIGVKAIFCAVSCLQSVKIRKCLLKMHGFKCIGGGSVPPPLSCQTLGRATGRKACCLALAEA